MTEFTPTSFVSPPSLETCDIFKIEPAFGRFLVGSHRMLLFHEPVAGLLGSQLRRAPCFLPSVSKSFSEFPFTCFRRNDP